MNERIREIAKQAYIADASKLPNWKFKPETEFLLKQLEGFTEKFAELIVRECAMFVVTELEGKVGSAIADTTANRLEEHFGVEE